MRGPSKLVAPIQFASWNSALIVIALTAVAVSPGFAQQQYNPNHPEVKSAVNKSLAYFDSKTMPSGGGDLTLAALAVVEASKRYDEVVPVDHPIVVKAVARIEEDLEAGFLKRNDSVYYPCLALILLCDVGDEKYRKEINTILMMLVKRQEPSGAFTYLKKRGDYYGDTSQTQYVSLAMWVAYKHGFNLPIDVPKRTLEWLLSVQLGNGGWYYEYHNGSSPHETKVTMSIQAASLGTVYLLGDFLQLNPRSKKVKAVDEKIAEEVAAGTALPPSVSVYVPPKEGEFSPTRKTDGPLARVDIGKLTTARRSGNQFLSSNFVPMLDRWGFYYLYALERYAYFRERAEGSFHEVPDWYDQGVKALFARQKDDGSFQQGRIGENGFRATCFAVLFLVRSSEVLVQASGEGNLSGGLGLKPNTRLDLGDGGKIRSFDVVRGLEDVLELLDSKEIDEQQYELVQDSLAKAIGQLSTEKSRTQREQLAFIRGLVSDRNYYRRLIAIKVLSRQQDMDNVPALIYALGDPDLRICTEAHNGLRLISRKLDTIAVSEQPDFAEYRTVKRQWTEWFLKIRPGAQLLD